MGPPMTGQELSDMTGVGLPVVRTLPWRMGRRGKVISDLHGRWTLGLVVGTLEILLGFWASQQYRPVQGALLLIWVGFFALFRGISEIVIAFELRRAQHP